jgi:hypothetical protein
MKVAFFSSSGFGTPVYIKRGTLFFLGHWALVIDNQEYHLVLEDGQPKLKDVLHKTAHLPDTHGSFTAKYFIGWSNIDKGVLRKKLKQIEADFDQYRFGGNDCRTFVALACDKALDGRIPILSPSVLVWLPLYWSGIWLPRWLPDRRRSRLVFKAAAWLRDRPQLFSLALYGIADGTLLHLSFHLIQTLTDGQYFSMPYI